MGIESGSVLDSNEELEKNGVSGSAWEALSDFADHMGDDEFFCEGIALDDGEQSAEPKKVNEVLTEEQIGGIFQLLTDLGYDISDEDKREVLKTSTSDVAEALSGDDSFLIRYIENGDGLDVLNKIGLSREKIGDAIIGKCDLNKLMGLDGDLLEKLGVDEDRRTEVIGNLSPEKILNCSEDIWNALDEDIKDRLRKKIESSVDADTLNANKANLGTFELDASAIATIADRLCESEQLLELWKLDEEVIKWLGESFRTRVGEKTEVFDFSILNSFQLVQIINEDFDSKFGVNLVQNDVIQERISSKFSAGDYRQINKNGIDRFNLGARGKESLISSLVRFPTGFSDDELEKYDIENSDVHDAILQRNNVSQLMGLNDDGCERFGISLQDISDELAKKISWGQLVTMDDAMFEKFHMIDCARKMTLEKDLADLLSLDLSIMERFGVFEQAREKIIHSANVDQLGLFSDEILKKFNLDASEVGKHAAEWIADPKVFMKLSDRVIERFGMKTQIGQIIVEKYSVLDLYNCMGDGLVERFDLDIDKIGQRIVDELDINTLTWTTKEKAEYFRLDVNAVGSRIMKELDVNELLRFFRKNDGIFPLDSYIIGRRLTSESSKSVLEGLSEQEKEKFGFSDDFDKIKQFRCLNVLPVLDEDSLALVDKYGLRDIMTIRCLSGGLIQGLPCSNDIAWLEELNIKNEYAARYLRRMGYIGENQEITERTGDLLDLLNNDFVFSYFNNHKIDDIDAFVVGCEESLMPLLERQKKGEDLAELEGYGRDSARSSGDSYNVDDFTTKCLTEKCSPSNIRELILISRELPTSDLSARAQNRADALAIEKLIIGDHYFIHEEQPGVHLIMCAICDYYDACKKGSKEEQAKSREVLEMLNSSFSNYRFFESATCQKNGVFGLPVDVIDAYERPARPIIDYTAGGVVEEGISCIDVARRLAKNTEPVSPVPPEKTSFEELDRVLGKFVTIDENGERRNSFYDMKTGAFNVNINDLSEVLPVINGILEKQQGGFGVMPSTVRVLSLMERMAKDALIHMNDAELGDLAFNPTFKEIVRFSQLTSSFEYDRNGFENFYRQLQRSVSNAHRDSGIETEDPETNFSLYDNPDWTMSDGFFDTTTLPRSGYEPLFDVMLKNRNQLVDKFKQGTSTQRYVDLVAGRETLLWTLIELSDRIKGGAGN